MPYSFVACQTFAGGFDMGMTQAGFQLMHKVEQEGGFGMPNCLANRHLLGDDWSYQASKYDLWEPRPAHVLTGNPPCSGFSAMTAQQHRGIDARVNQCMWVLANYAGMIRPYVIIMESVRQAYTLGRPLMQALRDRVEQVSGERYAIHHVFQNALELGGAAQRPRYFFVLARIPFGVEYPKISRTPVLRDVIADLEGLNDTWELQPYRRPPTWWSAPARSPLGVLDGHKRSSSPVVERSIELLKYNGEWPAGWPVARVLKSYYDRTGTVPPAWRGQLDKLIANNWFMGFTTMVRWNGERPARVVTGAGLSAVLHPWLPRTLTHRELARIMGFPDDWLIKPLGNKAAPTWGKGITVQCGRWIGDWSRRSLDGEPGDLRGIEIGEREYFIEPHPKRASLPRSAQRNLEGIAS